MATRLKEQVLVIGKDTAFQTVTVGVAYAEISPNQPVNPEMAINLLNLNIIDILSKYGRRQIILPESKSPIPEIENNPNYVTVDDEAIIEIEGSKLKVLVATISIVEESMGYKLIEELTEKGVRGTAQAKLALRNAFAIENTKGGLAA